MKIVDIYFKFMTPKNLQEHMLRVASLAEIILKYWNGPKINKKAIIQCCLLHDIAKPLNFDPKKQSQFGMLKSDIKRLVELQNLLINVYGTDEHSATVGICRDLELKPITIKMINNLEWNNVPDLMHDNDIESLIPIYCDMRIGPNGLLSIRERLSELAKRTGKAENLANGIMVEKLITKNINSKLDSITNNHINEKMPDLLQIEI